MSEKGYRYNRIKELYDYEFIRVFRKLFYNSLHVLSDKEIDELLEKEVFSNPLFQKDDLFFPLFLLANNKIHKNCL